MANNKNGNGKNKSTTGSFIGDIVKATKAGGASAMTKKVKVKKNETLSDIAKANNTTLRKLMSLNPKFKTGQDKGSPTKGTIEQKTIRVGATVIVPDPHTFKKGKLTRVTPKNKKDVYKKVTKKQFKEMNVPLKKKK
tara:strand:+ start:65 stop:475 length:411 start_codon:yes stop_codon:yes gene_type:complete